MADTKKIELLPCPFCGGDAEIRMRSWKVFTVRCTAVDCAIEGALFHEKEAIAAWNRRASIPLAEDVEGLCERLKAVSYGADEEDAKILHSAESMTRSLAGRVEAERRAKEEAERERDNARAECTWLAKRLLRERSLLSAIAEDIEDEGGRVYFGRTSDADALKDFAKEVENYDFGRITRESKWPDYIETSRAAHERLVAAEARSAALARALEDANRLRLGYQDAVRIDVLMNGPKFAGCNLSQLKRAWEAARAASPPDAAA